MLITLEREVKLRFENPVEARAAIVGIGALHRNPRRLQSDVLFDTDQRLLSSRGQVLRLRVESGTCRVTFKSPAEHPTMKLREELETTVGDGELFAAIHDGTSADMEGYKERMTDTEIWNVVNYVRSLAK